MGMLDRPFSSPDTFISDGGMETDLIFHEGAEMPMFASFASTVLRLHSGP